LFGVGGGSGGLDLGDLVQHLVQQGGEAGVDGDRVLIVEPGGEHPWVVPVAAHQVQQLALGDAAEHGGVGDLVPVQVQDRQHHTVGGGVDELGGVPAGGQRPGPRLPVAHHGEHQQVRVVEGGAVGVGEGVAELAALVDGPGGFRGGVRGDAVGEGELPEQPAQTFGVLGDVRVDLRVGALEVGVRHHTGTAVP